MIFLRHPVTDAPEGLCYGRHDVGWGTGAEGQVAAALAAIGEVPAIWTSPLGRCRRVASRFAASVGCEPIADVRLAEYDFGRWEGRLWSDIPRAESEAWTSDIQNAAPPGGERFTDLIARVRAALAEIPDGGLVITHAGPIRAARMILTGASFDEVFAWKVPYCAPLSLTREMA